MASTPWVKRSVMTISPVDADFRRGRPGWVSILLLAAAGCGSSPKPAQDAGVKKPGPVKIVQFYAAAPSVAPGQKVLLCYGVENAVSVRITPDVEPVPPAINRCVEASPRRTTEYTLTATGSDGKT